MLRFDAIRSIAVASALLAVPGACAPSDPASPIAGGGRADAGGQTPPDADGDTITDDDEGRAAQRDIDRDGMPDYLDPDSDDDGIPDRVEAGDELLATPPVDSDFDGTPDVRDTDSDGNRRPDGVDGSGDLDLDGQPDFADLDDDGDGLRDRDELGPAPGTPVDTDRDGTPDFQDLDSDGDTIADLHDGSTDPDGDGTAAYRDLDSDGDCAPDAVEAGDADPVTPPRNSDNDTRPDFLDLDADNDGLADAIEDPTCNGVLDPGETSAIDADTDGDGVSDLVEAAAGTDPTDASDNPAANGDFVFIVPYEAAPSPADDTLDFSTQVSQADVVFAMDTTGSMGGEIANLRASVGSLITTVRANIANTAFGAIEYEDFPRAPVGGAGDQPFALRHRVMTTSSAAGLASLQSQVNGYVAAGGADGPEAGWEMLYQLATGSGTRAAGANVPPFSSASAPPTPVPAGEQVGDIGGVGFRAGSLPMAVWFTDAPSHNSDVSGYNYDFTAARSSDAMAALAAISARVIGVVSADGDGDARPDVSHAVVGTGAVVPPSAWGAPGARPAGCGADQCCTGLSGAGEATDAAGRCPLIFRIAGNGSGLGAAVAKAVEVLTGFATLDIGAEARDDASDAVDAVAAFVERIEANPAATAPCGAGLVAIDTDADSVEDTFDDVLPGTTVCFDVIPRTNTTVMPTAAPQMFRATIVVAGDRVTTVDQRDVFFVVPPEVPGGPID